VISRLEGTIEKLPKKITESANPSKSFTGESPPKVVLKRKAMMIVTMMAGDNTENATAKAMVNNMVTQWIQNHGIYSIENNTSGDEAFADEEMSESEIAEYVTSQIEINDIERWILDEKNLTDDESEVLIDKRKRSKLAHKILAAMKKPENLSSFFGSDRPGHGLNNPTGLVQYAGLVPITMESFSEMLLAILKEWTLHMLEYMPRKTISAMRSAYPRKRNH